MNKTIRIATRKSPLALWQTSFVKAALLQQDPNLNITFVELTTQGDREQGKALADLGGKSLFVKELQKALLNNEADIAVHSIKDMSVLDCPGLTLAATCKREDPRDAFVSHHYPNINALPQNAIVGTSSPRRTALVKAQRPDLQIKLLRGNVNTRLKKCKEGEYDAAILAVAGLKRLNFEDQITDYLDPSIFIPAIGQGAIGIECRQDDEFTLSLLKSINHTESEQCIIAERAVNKVLGGDCHTPIAAHATISDGILYLSAMVGSLSGKCIIKSDIKGSIEQSPTLGNDLAQMLINQGAADLLQKKDD